MPSVGHDIRQALRCLARARGTTFLSILCLSLGIGVNTLVFSAVNGILLPPLPFVDPDRLVLMYEVREVDRGNGLGVSFPNFRDWKAQSAPFAELAALRSQSLTVSERSEHERYPSAYVTWNLFPLLGVQPLLGRGFQPDDDRVGAAPVLLSDTLWQREYAADRAIVGRSIIVDGQPSTVIGVMPRGFSFPRNERLWRGTGALHRTGRALSSKVWLHARNPVRFGVRGARAP